MTKVNLVVSEAWWNRCQSGIKASVGDLTALEHLILGQQLLGGEEPVDTLDRVYIEIMRIRRRIETFQIPF